MTCSKCRWETRYTSSILSALTAIICSSGKSRNEEPTTTFVSYQPAKQSPSPLAHPGCCFLPARPLTDEDRRFLSTYLSLSVPVRKLQAVEDVLSAAGGEFDGHGFHLSRSRRGKRYRKDKEAVMHTFWVFSDAKSKRRAERAAASSGANLCKSVSAEWRILRQRRH